MTKHRLDVTVITGMSGAGRSAAADVLEDLGYFVIDNLPPALIANVRELAKDRKDPQPYALVVDVRSGEFVDDLERALGQLRKRGARTPAAVARAGRELTEQRALLDRALAGERNAFDTLAEIRLAGVRKIIVERLSEGGREPPQEALDAALARTLSRAFERLHEKPERWSVHRWLAAVARRELEVAVPT